jgi:hypothetical protein
MIFMICLRSTNLEKYIFMLYFEEKQNNGKLFPAFIAFRETFRLFKVAKTFLI